MELKTRITWRTITPRSPDKSVFHNGVLGNNEVAVKIREYERDNFTVYIHGDKLNLQRNIAIWGLGSLAEAKNAAQCAIATAELDKKHGQQ